MKIENDFYVVDVDSESGAINRLFDKVGNLELIYEPRIGEAFRLLLPLPDQEFNYILSKEQQLSHVERTSTGLGLHWEGPLRGERGKFNLDVTMFIELVDKAVHFRVNVRNRTEYELAEIWYPLLGGIRGIGERKDTKTLIPHRGGAGWPNMFQNFPESLGIGSRAGYRFPEFFLTYPGAMPMPWVDFYNEKLKRGVYFACHDRTPRLGVLRFEMQPGVVHNSIGGNWPRPEELDAGVPEGILMSWIKFPYTKSGDTFEGPPVVIQRHEGDWYDAARIYRNWFESNFPLPDPKAGWLRKEQAYQDILCLLPEGRVVMPFKHIPQVAKDGLDYGVKALIVSSWNVGGHDSMYPRYEPDPRLGSWRDLQDAIAKCHEMEVKVFFFVNLEPIDLAMDWRRKELHKYLCRNKWGVEATHTGWGFGTLSGRLGYTRRPLAPANPGFSEFRELIVKQMRKLAEIGADGLHFDKLGFSIGLDFNPELSMSPDRAAREGALLALKEVLATCREVNPDFCLSAEHCWDRALQFADVAWVWTCAGEHIAVFKYTFPHWMPMVPVSQPYDYNMVNQAIRYGYQIMVSAAGYMKSMKDELMKPLSAYIQEVLRIRKELEDTIYFGEFMDTLEVEVETHADVKFNTHRNPKTGKRACVLANYGAETRRASVSFEGNENGKARIYAPFEKIKEADLSATVTIPPRRLCVVVEE